MRNTHQESGAEKILLIAKILNSFPNYKVFSFKQIEEKLKIKSKVAIHIFKILKEADALDFKVIPFGHKEKIDKLDKILGKDKVLPEGIILEIKNKKIISKIIKSPSLINPIIQKVGLYPEKPYFDEKKSTIFFEDKKIKIPSGNQFILCKIVFSRPFGEWISEDDLALAIDAPGSLQGNRFIYDTMLAINKKVEKCFDIKKFLEWNLSKLRVRKELFK